MKWTGFLMNFEEKKNEEEGVTFAIFCAIPKADSYFQYPISIYTMHYWVLCWVPK